MRILAQWQNANYGEESVLVEYQPKGDPASVQQIALPQGAEQAYIGGVTENEVYELRAGVVYQGTEYWGEWGEIEADPATILMNAETFDDIDIASMDFADIMTLVTDLGGEVVATLDNDRVAESTVRSTEITGFGQHKQAPTVERPQRLWLVLLDDTTGRVMRIFMERETAAATATEAISVPVPWAFEVKMDASGGGVSEATGTVTSWELSNATVDFANTKLSSDDGAWAVKDATAIQGNGSAPSTPYWGVGNWNSGDNSASAMFGTQSTTEFRAVVIMAPGPDSVVAPSGLTATYEA